MHDSVIHRGMMKSQESSRSTLCFTKYDNFIYFQFTSIFCVTPAVLVAAHHWPPTRTKAYMPTECRPVVVTIVARTTSSKHRLFLAAQACSRLVYNFTPCSRCTREDARKDANSASKNIRRRHVAFTVCTVRFDACERAAKNTLVTKMPSCMCHAEVKVRRRRFIRRRVSPALSPTEQARHAAARKALR